MKNLAVAAVAVAVLTAAEIADRVLVEIVDLAAMDLAGLVPVVQVAPAEIAGRVRREGFADLVPMADARKAVEDSVAIAAADLAAVLGRAKIVPRRRRCRRLKSRSFPRKRALNRWLAKSN